MVLILRNINITVAQNVFQHILIRTKSTHIKTTKVKGNSVTKAKLQEFKRVKAIISNENKLRNQSIDEKNECKLSSNKHVNKKQNDNLSKLTSQLFKNFETKRKYAPIKIKPAYLDTHSIKINSKSIEHSLIDVQELNIPETSKPPKLKHDLSRVLFEPMSLHPLKDLRTGIYNYNPSFEDISLDSMEMEIVRGMRQRKNENNNSPFFLKPHKDERLTKVAKKFDKQYISSTSSMTSVLSHLHFLLSNFRPLNIIDSPISTGNLLEQKNTYTKGAQLPAIFILRRKKDGKVSIDSDSSLDREIILSTLGHYLEKFLTRKHRKGTEHYHYSKVDDFIIRSQLDAYDSRLPGSGIFDLKTRAVVAVRNDLSFVEKNNNRTGYEINKLYGEFESLEREFFDLMRSTLLKYSFQARMGFMDGIFLAYHNISKIFGFQYIPLEEIDYIIHSNVGENFAASLLQRENCYKKLFGIENYIIKYQRNSKEIAKKLADAEFKISIKLFAEILNQIQSQYTKKEFKWNNLRVIVDTEKQKKNGLIHPVLNIIVCPLSDQFEDIPLSFKNDVLFSEEQLERLKLETLKVEPWQASQMIGLQVTVSHLQKHHPDTIGLIRQCSTLPSVHIDNKPFINRLNKATYPFSNHFETPEFFHPLDIEMWQVNANIKSIKNNDILAYYNKYLNKKLDILQLENQINVLSGTAKKSIGKKFNNCQDTKSTGKFTIKREGKSSSFQKILRAYSLRNDLKNSFRKNIF